MGLRLKKIYLDSNVFIAALSGDESSTKPAKDLLRRIGYGKLSGLTSVIIFVEIFKNTEPDIEPDNLINDLPNIITCVLDIQIAMLAQRLRRENDSLRAADAIHLATSINQKCNYFISEDKKLLKVASSYIKSQTLNEYINKRQVIEDKLNYVDAGKKFTREEMNEH